MAYQPGKKGSLNFLAKPLPCGLAMKRHRSESDEWDKTEILEEYWRKKSALPSVGGEYDAVEIWSPTPTLTCTKVAFSSHVSSPFGSSPVAIPSTILLPHDSALKSPSPVSASLEPPLCSTPEELKSPKLRYPPPTPHKQSPRGTLPQSSSSQSSIKSVPLQDVSTKIRLRPRTNQFSIESFAQLTQIHQSNKFFRRNLTNCLRACDQYRSIEAPRKQYKRKGTEST